MNEGVEILDVGGPDVVDRIVDCLKGGGVVVMPTETVYGIMTLASNQKGRDRIFEIKNRPESKLLQVLVGSVDMAKEYGGRFSAGAERVGGEFWPGGLTMVVDGPGEETTGFRLPDHELALRVIMALGEPLAATSANISGQPPIKDIDELKETFTEFPDLVIDGGECTGGVSSTVISTLNGELGCLREGGLSFVAIKCVWDGV